MQTDMQWQWPISLDSFALTTPLTTAEQVNLTALLRLREKPGRVAGYASTAREQLPRIVTPIQVALSHTAYGVEQYGPVIYLFLKQMTDTGKLFTDIEETVWENALNNSDYGALPTATARRAQHAFLVTLYLLKCFRSFHRLHHREATTAVRHIFGEQVFVANVNTVEQSLTALGYSSYSSSSMPSTLAEILLFNRSPHLKHIDSEMLVHLRATTAKPSQSRFIVRISYALFQLGILQAPLPKHPRTQQVISPVSEWDEWCQRWEATSTLAPSTRRGIFNILRQVRLWLQQDHPQITTPQQWDRQFCLQFVDAVCHLQRGSWTKEGKTTEQLLHASTRRKKIDAVRKFFQDLQAWEWIPRSFNPSQSLTAPAYLNAQIGPNPRIIANDIWAKLLQAALNLTEADIQPLPMSGANIPAYPLAMVRAVALIWVFGGLRNDEIRRLRVGCIRFEGETSVDTTQIATLRVPANKTSGRFEKPISHLAAEALLQWETMRPSIPSLLDSKTGEMCHFIFVYRGRRIGQRYINKHLIPMLCTKANVPLTDAKGKITSHRARATMSNALVTGENAMSLLELQTWLGHSTISSTMHYVKPSLTHLADTYMDTDYFERNLRLVDVLVDQNAIRNGATDHWLHYDLGHGYCNNDFFVHCAHRMACARCTFYLPKGSTQAQLLEAKRHLRHMMQSIELTDAEVAAVSGDLNAVENLLQSLQTVATPDGSATEVSP